MNSQPLSNTTTTRPHEVSSLQEESNERLDEYWNLQNDDVPMHAVLEEGDCQQGSDSLDQVQQQHDMDENDTDCKRSPRVSLSSSSSSSLPTETSIRSDAEHGSSHFTQALLRRKSFSEQQQQQQMDDASQKEYHERFDRARVDMLELLETRLQAKCGSGGAPSNDTKNIDETDSIMDDGNPQQPAAATTTTTNDTTSSQSLETIRQTAKALEQLLYEQSQLNLKVYQDISTLDSRLRDLMTILVRRRMMKRVFGSKSSSTQLHSKAMRRLVAHQQQQPSSSSSSSSTTTTSTPTTSKSSSMSPRTQRLLQILGKPQLLRIHRLIQEIRTLKTKKVATFCGAQGCTRAQPFQTQLPQVVRQLYFETPLVDCFQKTPLEKLASVPWEQLVQQAQSNVLAYQMWEMNMGK